MASYLTKNYLETKKLGGKIAKNILKRKNKKAVVLALTGELGSGKTTFLQGFARGLGIKEKILSPTFIVMKRFTISKQNSFFKNFFHIDCYRLEKAKEILDLGLFKEIINLPNIVALEWADRFSKIMPEETLWIKFSLIDENKRRIEITSKKIKT